MVVDAKRALLAQAANRLGVSPLAKELKVSDGLVAAWLSGHASMPDRCLPLLAALLEKLGDPPE
jgi:hypothetical protein